VPGSPLEQRGNGEREGGSKGSEKAKETIEGLENLTGSDAE